MPRIKPQWRWNTRQRRLVRGELIRTAMGVECRVLDVSDSGALVQPIEKRVSVIEDRLRGKQVTVKSSARVYQISARSEVEILKVRRNGE